MLNFIVIVADTFRRDHLACYGGDTGTPNLDRLATESVVLEDAYCASFPTLPCRAELFTAKITFPYIDWGALPAGEGVIAEAFTDAGYQCALVTDNLPMSRPRYGYERGFHTRLHLRGQWYDQHLRTPADPVLPVPAEKLGEVDRVRQYLRNVSLREGEEDYFAPMTVRAASQWLENNHRRGPFFLWLDLFDPHEPWDPPKSYLPAGVDPPWILYPRFGEADYYSPHELDSIRALYHAEVRMVDHHIGRFLSLVDSLGLRENTVVCFLSDHGIFIGEHNLLGKSARTSTDLRGWPPYVEVSRIPMMLRIPGVDPGRRAGFAHPADLSNALLDLAGLRRGDRSHAVSLLPMVRDSAPGRDIAVSSWSLRGWRTTRPSVVRDAEWSLVFWRSGVPPELYHRASDPGETRDVASQHPDEVRRLHAEYLRFLRENDTPRKNYLARKWLVSWGGSAQWRATTGSAPAESTT